MSTGNDVDYLLIGSGVAASTIAKRLLKKDPNASILMLEAGDFIPARDRGLWWNYVTTHQLPYDYTYDKPGANPSIGNTHWEMNKTRVTAYGGTTMHWGGWSLRMKPEDFFLYTNTGEGGDWLFTYDDLEPYYCQAEEHLQVGGDDTETWVPRSRPYPLPAYPWLQADIEIIEAFQHHGVRPGRMPLARYRRCMTTGTCRYCPVGARFNGQYVNEALENANYPNFEIRTQATVKKIRLDSRRQARGVSYLDRSSDTPVNVDVDARTVIVCAGAFESPKLLMMSTGSGWDKGIGNNYDQLGHYLVSHSFLSVCGTASSNPDRISSEFGFPTLMSRTFDSEAFQAEGKFFLFRNQNSPGQYWDGLMQQGKTREQMDEIATGSRQTGISAFYEEKGRYANYLTPEGMGGKTDQFGLPLMKVNFNRSPRVMQNANERLNLMGKIFASIPDYTMLTQSLEGAAGYHASGTCRMAHSPEAGVTDANLRVHGMDNIYICSNAVFPSIGAVNPTLTLTALAFRLADHLDGGLDCPAEKARGITS